MKRYVLWEETADGEIPVEFDTLEILNEYLLTHPKYDLATFEAVLEDEEGVTHHMTVEDRLMESYYESE